MPTFTLVLALILLLAYLVFVRPWQLHWGAREDEIKRAMPGDDIVKLPSFNATRAISIKAPAECIYPWIPQMGVGRAGWYSYDLLDNLARPSAEVILPEHQNIETGTLIPMSPDGKHGMWVKDYRENEWMLWWDKVGDSTWAWGIYEEANAQTRLVTRVHVRYRWLSPAMAFNLILEFFDIVMMRKCMLGIKRRAEALSSGRQTGG